MCVYIWVCICECLHLRMYIRNCNVTEMEYREEIFKSATCTFKIYKSKSCN